MKIYCRNPVLMHWWVPEKQRKTETQSSFYVCVYSLTLLGDAVMDVPLLGCFWSPLVTPSRRERIARMRHTYIRNENERGVEIRERILTERVQGVEETRRRTRIHGILYTDEKADCKWTNEREWECILYGCTCTNQHYWTNKRNTHTRLYIAWLYVSLGTHGTSPLCLPLTLGTFSTRVVGAKSQAGGAGVMQQCYLPPCCRQTRPARARVCFSLVLYGVPRGNGLQPGPYVHTLFWVLNSTNKYISIPVKIVSMHFNEILRIFFL